MNQLKRNLLLAAIALQAVVLVGMVLLSAMPLWTGTEIKVKTVPIDPRSLFRGNYARLGYEFSRFTSEDFESKESARRQGEIIYVPFKKDDTGIYRHQKPSFTKPESGLFLRGRLQNRFSWQSQVRVAYGIEAFFAPKEKALALEKKLRRGAIAVLMVDAGGKARIKDIVTEGENAN